MSKFRPVAEVRDQLLGLVEHRPTTQHRLLDMALGCCLATDITSPVNVPPADNSAMDGYALAARDASTDRRLRVSDRIPAGSVGNRLVPGTCARIFTGAEIPEGADTVVMQENTEVIDDSIRLLAVPEAGANVRSRGQDIEAGAVVARRGEMLNARRLALIASVGVPAVEVFKPLTVAIMSTGDELVEPGGSLQPGQIYNSNRYGLVGLLRELGFNVMDIGIVGDSLEAIMDALGEAAGAADCIITSGGVSVGEEDHVKAAVEAMGEIAVWKLAIKPGKPLAYGRVGETPFFGLPGNPVSTFVTFTVLAKPYLLALQGFTDVVPPGFTARAAFDFRGGGREEYLRVRLTPRAGETWAEKYHNQGSGVMTSVVWADALAKVEAGQQVNEGDMLTIFPV